MKGFFSRLKKVLGASLEWEEFNFKLRDKMNSMHELDDPWSNAEYINVFKDILNSSKFFDSCLEVGAGQGHVTEVLASRFAKVSCVELSANALEKAKKKVSASKSSLEFFNENIHDLKLHSQSQVLILSFVLDYLGFKEFPHEFASTLEKLSKKTEKEIIILNPVYCIEDAERMKFFSKFFIDKGFHPIKTDLFNFHDHQVFACLLRRGE